MTTVEVDTIGGFPVVCPTCIGCEKPLTVENAWMTDGCPCNSRLGFNSLNETRWRLLMELQGRQSREIERLKAEVKELNDANYAADEDEDAAVAETLAVIRRQQVDLKRYRETVEKIKKVSDRYSSLVIWCGYFQTEIGNIIRTLDAPSEPKRECGE